MSDSVTKSIIVGGAPSDIFAVWSNFAMFPQFMKYIEEVTVTGANRSHWVMKGPLGYTAEWDARRRAWRQTSASPGAASTQMTPM